MSNRTTIRRGIDRRTFLKAGASVAAAGPLWGLSIRRASAADFSYKLATGQDPTHPVNVRAQQACDKIRAATNGKLDIKVFPSNQLGSDTDLLSQVRSGGVEFFNQASSILATLAPAAGIVNTGFAFPDYDTVWKALDGDLGAYIRSEIQGKGLVVMDKIWDNGFRQVTTSTKPINGPDDFHDLKIRVPVSPLWTSMFKALGAAPASINFNEVYSSLQTKVVDAQENPLAIIDTAKLYEVQKYCSMTNHMWDGFWFLGNRRAWEKLPKDVQAVVAKHLNAAGVAERADVAALDKQLQSKLAGKGMVFNTPAPAPIRDALRKAGFYTEWQKKYGDKAWALLEKSVGKLS